MNINRLIISAPFGNYLNFDGITSTIGTYTLKHRAGLLKRLWKVVSTVRYSFRTKSWINKLGLPNPGINKVKLANHQNKIISLHGFCEQDWTTLVQYPINGSTIELNLSCPNVHHNVVIAEVKTAIKMAQDRQHTIIAKLPPVRWMHLGSPLFELGIKYFHLCNTIPTSGGGWSGKILKQYSLWAIDDFRKEFGGLVTLIGGGGVTCLDDVAEYVQAGVDHVAVGSMLFNLFNWNKIKDFAKYLEMVFENGPCKHQEN